MNPAPILYLAIAGLGIALLIKRLVMSSDGAGDDSDLSVASEPRDVPPPFPDSTIGTEADIASYINRLVTSPGDAGTLIIQVVGADPFLQFAGGASGIQMDFPLITAAQRSREPRIRRFLQERSIKVQVTLGDDGSRFLDADLPADAALVSKLASDALPEIFELSAPLQLAFMGEGWGGGAA